MPATPTCSCWLAARPATSGDRPEVGSTPVHRQAGVEPGRAEFVSRREFPDAGALAGAAACEVESGEQLGAGVVVVVVADRCRNQRRSLENRLRAKGLATEADGVDAAVEDVASTIEELRDLTDQLPLTQLDAGIGAAFRELAGRAPLPVEVQAPDERYGPGVEATAYFVGCEGLTNVIKHARASVATLSAVRRDGSLVVTVSDDGVGGAAARPGSGLAGLADRVAAAGGRLLVRSDPTGTRLEVELPCA
jgi:signal transduction histidine kinase